MNLAVSHVDLGVFIELPLISNQLYEIPIKYIHDISGSNCTYKRVKNLDNPCQFQLHDYYRMVRMLIDIFKHLILYIYKSK